MNNNQKYVKFLANSRTNKMCVFCKYWFNPAYKDITIKTGGFVEFNREMKCPCKKMNNLPIRATHICPKFEKNDSYQ